MFIPINPKKKRYNHSKVYESEIPNEEKKELTNTTVIENIKDGIFV
jgi:hypothetical protein